MPKTKAGAAARDLALITGGEFGTRCSNGSAEEPGKEGDPRTAELDRGHDFICDVTLGIDQRRSGP